MFEVLQSHHVTLAPDSSDKALKQQLAALLPVMPRRMDRLALLTLLVAAPFRAKLAPGCGIYLAADYPSLANMYALLDSVVVQQQLPKPFEFVNSVSNAASFYAAQMLELDGPNLFLGAGENAWQALAEYAYADLQCGITEQALLIRCQQGQQQLSGEAVALGRGNWRPAQWQFAEFCAVAKLTA